MPWVTGPFHKVQSCGRLRRRGSCDILFTLGPEPVADHSGRLVGEIQVRRKQRMKAVVTEFKNTRTVVQLSVLMLLLCGLAGQAWAQSTALLGGTVTDDTGSAIPNARVAAT